MWLCNVFTACTHCARGLQQWLVCRDAAASRAPAAQMGAFCSSWAADLLLLMFSGTLGIEAPQSWQGAWVTACLTTRHTKVKTLVFIYWAVSVGFCSSLVFLPCSVTSQSAWGTCGAHYVFLNRSGAIPTQCGSVVTNRSCQIAGVHQAKLLAGWEPVRSRSPLNCQGWGLLRDLEMMLAPPKFKKLNLFPHVWVSRLGTLSDVSGGREIAGKQSSVCASLCNHEMRA